MRFIRFVALITVLLAPAVLPVRAADIYGPFPVMSLNELFSDDCEAVSQLSGVLSFGGDEATAREIDGHKYRLLAKDAN